MCLLARTDEDIKLAVKLIDSPLAPISSQLESAKMHGDGLAMLLLESVAAGLVQTTDEADLLLRSTLWWEDQVRMQTQAATLSRLN